MRGKRFVYGSYRGRRSTTDVLKTVALILAVLVVLAVAGVWMAQKYIVYDDGGYHLELPFFQKEGPAQEPEDFRVAVEPAASQPEETPEEGEPLLAAVTVPLSAVEDGSAEALAAQGCAVMEDAGRGYRKVVASPQPKAIVELAAVRALTEAGQVVVACGGGGIPVCRAEDGSLQGAEAVIDKDFAAELLAESLDADLLIILTAVEKVAIRFRQPGETWLSELTPEEAEVYIAAGEFGAGSMLPKVEAAVRFARSAPGRAALITELQKARAGIAGETGTRIREA